MLEAGLQSGAFRHKSADRVYQTSAAPVATLAFMSLAGHELASLMTWSSTIWRTPRYNKFNAAVLSRFAHREWSRLVVDKKDPQSNAKKDRLRNLSPQKSKSDGSSSYI